VDVVKIFIASASSSLKSINQKYFPAQHRKNIRINATINDLNKVRNEFICESALCKETMKDLGH